MLASLLREPQHIERVGNASFSMRYRTINGELVDRETYVASLVAAGQAVVSEDEVVWTYPVMDVRVNSNRSNSRPEELFRKVNPVASPESLIATQLLHQAASTPTTRPSFDFANEAIFRRFDNQRDPTSPVVVACVFWDCNDCQVALDYQNTADRHPEFGVRSTVSGI